MSMKKDYINHIALSEPKTGVLFSDFVNKVIERKAKRMSPSYMNNYKTVLKHFKNDIAKQISTDTYFKK